LRCKQVGYRSTAILKRGYMKNYRDGKAGQYPKDQAQRRYNIIQLRVTTVILAGGIIMGMAVGFFCCPWVYYFLPWTRQVPKLVYWGVTFGLELLAFAVAFVSFRKLQGSIDTLSRERIHYLRGGQTEALVAYALQALDDNWHLFNGIAMKCGGDIDHVLVGPGGLFCMSTKSCRGLLTRGAGDGVMLNGNPNDDVAEVQRQAMTLRHWLEARLHPDHAVKSIPFVRPVLVVPFAFIDFPRQAMNVWVLSEDELFDVATASKSSLNASTIAGCAKVLQDLTTWPEHRRQAVVTEKPAA
jgi:Nuclease-related domain